MGRMVQYSDIAAVISAYELQGIPVWAVFHDKQLISKYAGDDIQEGAEHLGSVLQQWKDSGSWAVYTIALYEELGAGAKIKSTTPYDTSFNFQLNKNTSSPRVGGIERGSIDYTDLAVENAVLKMELAQLRSEIEGSEEVKEDPLLGAIGKIMQIPGIDGLIGAIASRASEFVMSVGKSNIQEPAKIYGSDGQEIKVRRVSGIDVTSGRAERLHVAVEELQKQLPECAELLEKLVMIAKKKPGQFKFFVMSLKMMKV